MHPREALLGGWAYLAGMLWKSDDPQKPWTLVPLHPAPSWEQIFSGSREGGLSKGAWCANETFLQRNGLPTAVVTRRPLGLGKSVQSQPRLSSRKSYVQVRMPQGRSLQVRGKVGRRSTCVLKEGPLNKGSLGLPHLGSFIILVLKASTLGMASAHSSMLFCLCGLCWLGLHSVSCCPHSFFPHSGSLIDARSDPFDKGFCKNLLCLKGEACKTPPIVAGRKAPAVKPLWW